MPTILMLILFGMSFSSHAVPPYSCRNGHFPTYEGIHLAEIVGNGSEKVYARGDWDGCPEHESCIQKGYLIKGDRVLATNTTDGWVCIYYFGKKRDYVGWVKQHEVKDIITPTTAKTNGWLGKWASIGGIDSIQIRSGNAGMLEINGKAKWLGGKNSSGEEIVHFGQVQGVARPNENRVVISEGDENHSCVLTLNLIDAFLIATDNEKCGGMNVRFNGVYKQKL